ncbi:MAG: peptidoglycan-associated lipoprotein Pal [Rickettsiaceae bacterium]|nr:MAG: peptidoglycan-associated lipoprotein Pal [Rickettsiaceae bacterium]
MNKIAATFCTLFFLAGCSTGYNTKPTQHTHTQVEETVTTIAFDKAVGDRVFFAYDSSELSQHAKTELEKQIAWLNNHHKTKIMIEGHCDERGTREYNLALGERRAEAVKKFMHHHGVELHRINTVSYGNERPAIVGNTEKEYKQNRRSVTIVE